MPLEELINQIEEDANQEIDRIIGEAKTEVKKIIKEAEKKAKEEGEILKNRAERELANKRRSELSRIRQEVKKEIMKKKEEIIRNCFEQAMDKLRKLSSKEYIALVKPLIISSLKEVGKDCIILPSRKEDKEIAKELKLQVDSKMIKAVGGVIIKSKDGKRTVNITFEEILKRRESEIRAKIGKILFGEVK